MKILERTGKSQPRTLRQEVYIHLKQDIITCRLAPGELLNEGDLAEQMGVSKTPVREALSQLQKDNLVKLISRKGYLVTTLTLRDIQEIFETRLILERSATELAAERITEEEIKMVESYLKINFDPNDSSTFFSYIQANTDFHLEIARASHNSRLVEHLAREFIDAQRLQFMDLDTGEGPWAWLQDHERILKALRDHDPKAAAAAVEDSIAGARIRLLSL